MLNQAKEICHEVPLKLNLSITNGDREIVRFESERETMMNEIRQSNKMKYVRSLSRLGNLNDKTIPKSNKIRKYEQFRMVPIEVSKMMVQKESYLLSSPEITITQNNTLSKISEDSSSFCNSFEQD